MRKMLINAPARGDLDSIDNYLRLEKSNPQAADHFVSEVRKAYDSVSSYSARMSSVTTSSS